MFGETQSSMVWHWVRHAPPPHLYALQGVVLASAFFCVWSSMQLVPVGFGSHCVVIALHTPPAMQSASLWHCMRQAPPAQMKGAHCVVVPGTQFPVASQSGAFC